MLVREMSVEQRPRERLKEIGVSGLSDAELLAIVLGSGSVGENVIDMSHRLIANYSLEKLSSCSLTELQSIKGIGLAKACQIKAIFELKNRVNYNKKNCNSDNLISLCLLCHRKTNGNRDYWTNYFKKSSIGEFNLEAGGVKLKDKIRIIGPTTGVVETKVTSLFLDKEPVKSARKTPKVTIPIPQNIRRNDQLYVVRKAN